MLSRISQLRTEEQDLIKKAPVLVGLLIASADHEIESSEIQRIVETVHVKTFSEKNDVSDIYHEIKDDVMVMIKEMLAEFPSDPEARLEQIKNILSGLNPVMKKLDNIFARQLYKSLKSLAVSVANASGGVLGMGTMGPAEKELLGLDMIEDPANYA